MRELALYSLVRIVSLVDRSSPVAATSFDLSLFLDTET